MLTVRCGVLLCRPRCSERAFLAQQLASTLLRLHCAGIPPPPILVPVPPPKTRLDFRSTRSPILNWYFKACARDRIS